MTDPPPPEWGRDQSPAADSAPPSGFPPPSDLPPSGFSAPPDYPQIPVHPSPSDLPPPEDYPLDYDEHLADHGAYRPLPADNGTAIAALVCSLTGILCCGIPSLVGVVLGIIAMTQIDRTGQRGRGLALAGVVVGAVVTLLWSPMWISIAVAIVASL